MNKELVKFLKHCKKDATLANQQINLIIAMVVFAAPEKAGAYKEMPNSIPVDIKDIRIILDWGKMKPTERLNDAEFKVGMWNASTYCPQPFPENIPTLVQYGTFMAELKKTLAVVGTNKPSKPQNDAIKKASKNLLKNTEQIMTVWQNCASTDPVNGIAIANDGGFGYSFGKGRGPRVSGLFRTTEEGKLLGQLTGGGHRQWQSTADLCKIIVNENPTSSGIIVLPGLTTDVKYGVRGRLVLSKGRYGDWSPWMWETAP